MGEVESGSHVPDPKSVERDAHAPKPVPAASASVALGGVAFGTASDVVGYLSTTDDTSRAEAVKALQRSAGNCAVSRMIGRQAATVGVSASDLIDRHTGMLGTLDEGALAGDLAHGLPGQSGLVEQVLDRLSSTDRDDVSWELALVLSDASLSALPDGLRMRMVNEMVHGWVTDDEEGEIARIWRSFGERLPEVAAANRALWKLSVEESDQLNELPQIQAIREAFRFDVTWPGAISRTTSRA